MKIPLTKPYWDRREEQAVTQALRNSSGSGDGRYSKKLSEELRKITGSKFIFPVTSCTHGLELAMSVLHVCSGDEVIIPSFTMTSTANAVVLRGAKPVFADIEGTCYSINPVEIVKKITKKTRGIILVHYAGMPCFLEKIREIAKHYGLFVVEDAAHAIGSRYKGRMLGTWGDIGVYSFHGTKNVSCGEGGAIVTDNPILAEKIGIFRANGTNRDKFTQGVTDKYSWIEIGSSYFLSDILAALVIAQIKKMQTIIRKRERIAKFYTKLFSPYKRIIQLPVLPPDTLANWHIYAIRFLKRENRDFFIKKMRIKGIEVSFHYTPLHSSLAGKKYGVVIGTFPVTDSVSNTLVRLPIYPGLTGRQLRYISDTSRSILDRLI